jgi:hypothetical protein
MSSIGVGGSAYGSFGVSGGGDDDDSASAVDQASGASSASDPCALSLEQKAALPADQLAKLPTNELVEVGERYPEALAKLPNTKLAAVGNARPELLNMLFHSDAATVPSEVPSGYSTGTHVFVKNSGIDLPWLVQLGVNHWKGKEFKPAKGELEDDVAGLPDSYAKAYLGDINAAVQGAANKGDIVAPVNDDDRGALITDYTKHSQPLGPFGPDLRWIDEFRQLPNGSLLGVSYWMDGSQPKKWSYVLLDPPKPK